VVVIGYAPLYFDATFKAVRSPAAPFPIAFKASYLDYRGPAVSALSISLPSSPLIRLPSIFNLPHVSFPGSAYDDTDHGHLNLQASQYKFRFSVVPGIPLVNADQNRRAQRDSHLIAFDMRVRGVADSTIDLVWYLRSRQWTRVTFCRPRQYYYLHQSGTMTWASACLPLVREDGELEKTTASR
jgi:hypothetical protein